MKVAVFGGGPAGLTAANVLALNNIEVHLYEAAPSVGGLAKTVTVFNEQIELGPHFFTASFFNEFKTWVTGLESIRYREFKRASSILLNDRYFDYPPSPGDIIRNNNIGKLFLYGLFFLARKKNSSVASPDAASYLTSKLGRKFYQDFFHAYINKIWGCPADEIHALFATTLMGNRSLSVKALLDRLLNRGDGKLAGTVIYPEGGFSSVWNSLEQQITTHGGQVNTNAVLSAIRCEDQLIKVVTGIKEEQQETAYDRVISTIPPLITLRLLKAGGEPIDVNACTQASRFRHLVIVYTRVELSHPFDANCLYIFEEDTAVARITNLSSFKSDPQREAIMSFEYWVDEHDEIWKNREESVIEQVKKDCKQIKAFYGAVILAMEVKKIRNAFLVPDLNMPATARQVSALLSNYPLVITTGRNASLNFNYSMEDAIKDGHKVACDVIKEIGSKKKQMALSQESTI